VEAPSPFARVLCGVDASEAGLNAVRQVRRLSPKGAGRPLLVGVSESHLAAQAGMLASHAVEDIESAARRALDEAEMLAGAAETRFVRGRADEVLLQLAADATLVAVGSHGHRRVAGILLGSVATRMLHDAPCSVLLARSAAEPERFPRSIVVGVDGSPSSLWAAAVAHELGTRLEAPVSVVAARGVGPLDIDLSALESSDLAIEYTDAKPVEALLGSSRDADLLVVGSRGLRGLRALGSVSERVAHQAACSLLVLRPHERESP
jgi:nucleotide-binding universal stress UspA family protein